MQPVIRTHYNCERTKLVNKLKANHNCTADAPALNATVKELS